MLIVALAGALVALFFLGLYVAREFRFPIGFDSPRYLLQTNYIAERGVGAAVPNQIRPGSSLPANRPGFPVITLTFSSLIATSTFRVATVTATAGVVATALAAAAFASWVLRLKAWQFAVIALVVGVSAQVIRLFAPESYTDNLFAAAVFMAAFVLAIAAVHENASLTAGALLLGTAAVIHPGSSLTVFSALGLAALAYAPASWKQWRSEGSPPWRTPTARMLLMVLGGGLLAGLVLFALIGAGPELRRLDRSELGKKLAQDWSIYLFPLTLPLAAVGAFLLVGRTRLHESNRRRFTTWFFAAWVLVSAVGILAYYAGRDVAAHRFLAFLLPLPILVGLGVIAVALFAARRVAVAAGVLAAVLGVGAFAFLGYRELYVGMAKERGLEWLDKAKVNDVITTRDYLDGVGVPETAPVVFVIDDYGDNPRSSLPQLAYLTSSLLPPARVDHAHFYVGTPDRYLAGEPTFRRGSKNYEKHYREVSAVLWANIRRLLPQRPVALMLAAYNPAYLETLQRHPELPTINNVMVLNGPRPPSHESRHHIPATGPFRLFGLGLGLLVLLAVAGLGWAIAIVPRGLRWFEAVALAPALGLTFVILLGVLVDGVGIRLTGFAGAATPVVAAAMGWALGVRRFVRTPGLFSPA